MFLGYQKDKIALTANTREELENNKFIHFDKIEETAEEYELYNGQYILKSEADAQKAQDDIKQQIETLEAQITDRNLRGAILGDEWALNKVQEIEAQIAELRKQLEV